MGRPSSYTPEIAKEICDRIAVSSKGLDLLCAESEEFPDPRTVHRWLSKYEEFRQIYADARVRQADYLFDECLAIADHKAPDFQFDPEKGLIVDGDAIARAKLRIDTRKWIASKLNAKKYGDSHTIKGDKDAPLQVEIASRLDAATKLLEAGDGSPK